jgi:hypothetical protein
MTETFVALSRTTPAPVAPPQKTALARVGFVLDWLRRARDRFGRCGLHSYCSQVVRICRAADERGIRLDGVRFIQGGEPLTETRAADVRRTGATILSTFMGVELGTMGVGCGDPEEVDECHLAPDFVEVLESPDPDEDGALCFTSLLQTTSMVMLNASLGDAGRLFRRSCGCLLGELGLDRRVASVRSLVRATAEGMSVPVADLIALVDTVLRPGYGGSALDYQWQEVEGPDGAARLRLLVDPRVGPLDAGGVLADVLGALARRGPGSRLVADVWRNAGTLELHRAVPETTTRGKTLPFLRTHSVRPAPPP